MREVMEFTKLKTTAADHLNFDIIIGAINGDIECIYKIIEYYNPYIKELASKKLFDKYGNSYNIVDETVRCQLENKLIKSVLRFEISV